MSSQVVDFNNTESGSTHVDDYWVQIQVCCHTDLTDLTSLGIRAMFGDQCKIDLLLSSLLVSLNMKKCSMKTYLRVREGERERERESGCDIGAPQARIDLTYSPLEGT